MLRREKQLLQFCVQNFKRNTVYVHDNILFCVSDVITNSNYSTHTHGHLLNTFDSLLRINSMHHNYLYIFNLTFLSHRNSLNIQRQFFPLNFLIICIFHIIEIEKR